MLLPPLLIIGDGTRTKSVKQIDGIQEIALSSGQCDVSACAEELQYKKVNMNYIW